MRHKRQHPGFIIMAAIVLIPLFGLAILLTTSQTAQMSSRVRQVEKRIEQKNQQLSTPVHHE